MWAVRNRVSKLGNLKLLQTDENVVEDMCKWHVCQNQLFFTAAALYQYKIYCTPQLMNITYDMHEPSKYLPYSDQAQVQYGE